MHKYFLLLTLLFSCNLAFCQKQEYQHDFQSSLQIHNYLSSNYTTLDPVEGEYDVQNDYRTDSPFANDGTLNYILYFIKIPNTNSFAVYVKNKNGDFYKSDKFRLESIGTTNAYRLYWGNSSGRMILDNYIRLRGSIELSTSDKREFINNPQFAYRLVLDYDMVKKYPTGDMYANAGRKAIEEQQPKEWTGTGFALTNNYIVTNNHVVEGAKVISIQGINGDFNHKYEADVVATDKINDLAIIKVKGVNIPSSNIPYSVKTGTSEVGEEVFVLGYPLTSTMGEEIKLTTGIVSSKTGFQGDVSIYQISAPIQPGNSGGPLFDSKGNVIGIVSAKHQGAENVGYAIKTTYLKNLMESAVSTNILPQTNKVSGLNLSGKVKIVKNYVYYIICSSNGKVSSTPPSHTNTNPVPQNNYQKYIDAAKEGEPEAQFRIGVCYWLGDGVAKDLSKAAYWWQIGADQGSASCQYNLGLLYIKGEGVNQDLAIGAALVKKAAEQEMPEAQNKLAIYYRDGIGVTSDIKQAFIWWEKAAKQGNVNAQVNLGVCYADGLGVKKDIKQAKYWWEKAANHGDSVAKKNLESLDSNNKKRDSKPATTPNNNKNEQNDYQDNIEAAKTGDPKAQVRIGVCYQIGKGVKQDYKKAVEWFEKSAVQGNSDAQTCLGLCYGMGYGVSEDFSEAIKWWRKAANQDNAQAQYYLGNCYNYGTGVSVDYTHAALWYQKAADHGNANAQFMLGVYYSTGKGVHENAADAASWWLKAAIQGHVESQFFIGICYENGEGVEKDGKQALYWFRKAAEQGHTEAKNKIK